MKPDLFEKNEIVQELEELRRKVIATNRRLLRKKQNVSVLNELKHDFGEEAVRLEWHQPNYRPLLDDIKNARKDVARGVVSGEPAHKLLEDLTEYAKDAEAELDDIRVPHMSRVWAAEARHCY